MLVNNAAAGGFKPFLEWTDAQIDHVTELNVRAPWDLCRAVLPSMLERGRGAIVNLSSQTAELPVGPPFTSTLPAHRSVPTNRSSPATRRAGVRGIRDSSPTAGSAPAETSASTMFGSTTCGTSSPPSSSPPAPTPAPSRTASATPAHRPPSTSTAHGSPPKTNTPHATSRRCSARTPARSLRPVPRVSEFYGIAI